MSFTKTISTIAALGSIFGVGLASWKISEEIKKTQTTPLEEKIAELEKQLEEVKTQKPVEQVVQPPQLPAPEPAMLPPATPPPPVSETSAE
jgi:hypothetical protein